MSDAQTFMAELGALILSERTALGITQGEIARALGVSDATVSAYERGEVMMSTYSHAVLKQYFRREHENRRIAGRAEVTA